MLADRLRKGWRARRESTAIDALMRFSDEGLVLGAGTVLAPCGGSSRDVRVDPLDPRLRALLTAAHARQPAAGSLAHLRKAAERWGEGQDALAAVHLALSRLDQLERPEADAHRLFLADGLLKAGVRADVVIEAVEARGASFEGLRKYDPDQPRVPAGSGRVSGQWTSGDGGGAATPRLLAGLIPNITLSGAREVAEDDACYQSKMDCYEAAMQDSDSGQANDNWKEDDIRNCWFAEHACILLSLAIQYVPLLDRGGVIFPHGGVVIIEKGKKDLYLRPPARGKIPPFRRGPGGDEDADPGAPETGAAPDRGAGAGAAGGFPCPPWSAAPDETTASGAQGFGACQQALAQFASQMKGKVTDEACSISRLWGKVVRAKIAFEHDGAPATILATCWSGAGPGVAMAAKVDCC